MIAVFFISCRNMVQGLRVLAAFLGALFLLAACGTNVPTGEGRPSAVTPADAREQAAGQDNAVSERDERDSKDDSDDTAAQQRDQGVRVSVAVMLPLSGPEEAAGKALLRAATMALFDAYDPRIRLIPYDTQADALVAEAMAEQAVRDGVSVVLGPLLSDSVRAAGAVFARANITVIGFSNDSTVAAPGRYLMGFLPESEVKRVVDYAVQKGHQKFGALIPEGLYGQRVRTAFGDTIVDAGAIIEAIESYPPGAPEALDEPVKRLARYDERRSEARREVRFLRGLRDDLTNEIADKIEDVEVLEGVAFDAVLVPEGGAMMRSLAPLLPFYEVDPNLVQLIGTGLWNDSGLLGEPPMQGAWFAAPEPEMPAQFLTRYEQAYGDVAPRIATLAYDAMALVAQLARTPLDAAVGTGHEHEAGFGEQPYANADDTANLNETLSPQPHGAHDLFSPDRITVEEGFVGLDGLFRFRENGEIERSLAILEVNRSGFVVVDPAQKSFPAFGYLLN